jgi:hypothetical protein
MRRAVVVVLALLGGFALLAVVAALVVGVVAMSSKGSVPRKTILEVDFEHGYAEYVPDDPVTALLSGKQATVRDVVEALERAAGTTVAGIGQGGKRAHGRAPGAAGRRGRARKSGSLRWPWPTFGEFSVSGAYYLATGFDDLPAALGRPGPHWSHGGASLPCAAP